MLDIAILKAIGGLINTLTGLEFIWENQSKFVDIEESKVYGNIISNNPIHRPSKLILESSIVPDTYREVQVENTMVVLSLRGRGYDATLALNSLRNQFRLDYVRTELKAVNMAFIQPLGGNSDSTDSLSNERNAMSFADFEFRTTSSAEGPIEIIEEATVSGTSK